MFVHDLLISHGGGFRVVQVEVVGEVVLCAHGLGELVLNVDGLTRWGCGSHHGHVGC